MTKIEKQIELSLQQDERKVREIPITSYCKSVINNYLALYYSENLLSTVMG